MFDLVPCDPNTYLYYVLTTTTAPTMMTMMMMRFKLKPMLLEIRVKQLLYNQMKWKGFSKTKDEKRQSSKSGNQSTSSVILPIIYWERLIKFIMEFIRKPNTS